MHYTQVKIDIEKQEILVPLTRDQQFDMKNFKNAINSVDFTPVDLHLIGPGEIIDNRLKIMNSSFPLKEDLTIPSSKDTILLRASLSQWNDSDHPQVSAIRQITPQEFPK